MPESTAGQYRDGWLYAGYSPNVETVADADTACEVAGLELEGRHQSRDGWVREYRWPCADPECVSTREECEACNGTGKPGGDPDLELEAARLACDESDEDPIDILSARGLI
jgi:hypothetical protein